MTLQLNRLMHIQESPEKLPFSIRKLGGGYSVLRKTSGEFQKFSKCDLIANVYLNSLLSNVYLSLFFKTFLKKIFIFSKACKFIEKRTPLADIFRSPSETPRFN